MQGIGGNLNESWHGLEWFWWKAKKRLWFFYSLLVKLCFGYNISCLNWFRVMDNSQILKRILKNKRCQKVGIGKKLPRKWHDHNLPSPGQYRHKNTNEGKTVAKAWRKKSLKQAIYHCPVCKRTTVWKPNILNQRYWHCTSCNIAELTPSLTYQDLKKQYKKLAKKRRQN